MRLLIVRVCIFLALTVGVTQANAGCPPDRMARQAASLLQFDAPLLVHEKPNYAEAKNFKTPEDDVRFEHRVLCENLTYGLVALIQFLNMDDRLLHNPLIAQVIQAYYLTRHFEIGEPFASVADIEQRMDQHYFSHRLIVGVVGVYWERMILGVTLNLPSQ